MITVLVVVVIAAVLGVSRGGSLQNLAATHFGWTWVLAIALALQIVVGDIFAPDGLPRISAVRLLVVSYSGVALFMLLNKQLPGMLVAALGLALNAIVIFANDAMPVSAWAARIAGAAPVGGDMGIKHEPAGPDTVLSFLADVIPIPYTSQVVSAGDLVLAVGLGVLVYRQSLAERPSGGARKVSD